MDTETSEAQEWLLESSQHLRDFKLAIEFKHLMTHAPGGIYLMPEFDNIRILHGVMFVRRGLYRDGVFRFIIQLSKEYNCLNQHPVISFTPPVFHPLIHPETGVFDLRLEEGLREWLPERHFLGTALAHLKKAFYLTSFESYTVTVPNELARTLCHEAKEEFLVQVKETVQASLARVSDPPPIGCSILFTEPRPAHDKIRTRIFGTRSVSTDSVTAEDDTGSVPSDTKTHDRASINLEDAYDENSTIVGRISTSEPFFEALLVEAKKPFVYDCSNEVEDADDRANEQA